MSKETLSLGQVLDHLMSGGEVVREIGSTVYRNTPGADYLKPQYLSIHDRAWSSPPLGIPLDGFTLIEKERLEVSRNGKGRCVSEDGEIGLIVDPHSYFKMLSFIDAFDAWDGGFTTDYSKVRSVRQSFRIVDGGP